MRGAAIISAFAGAAAWAQVAPDAARILQGSQGPEQSVAPVAGPSINIVEPLSKPGTAPGSGLRFRIDRVRISGNTVFAEEQLLPLVVELSGRDITLTDLQQAAARITDFYRRQGYLVARAYIPAQDIQNGSAAIAILEGRVGTVSVQLKDETRAPASQLRAIAAANLPAGEVVRDRDLERALLLMRDLPGVEARSTLRAGLLPGTSDIVVEADGGSLLSGNVDFDTYGEKYSGIERLGATLNLNSPLHLGDQANFRAIHAAGSDYARARYQLPITASGLSAGAAYSELTYRLCCDFSALHASGKATLKSVYARYPLQRSLGFNLNAGLVHEEKDFFNRTIAGTVSDYNSRVTTVSLSGNRRDRLAGGGLSVFSLSLGSGNLNLDSLPANKAADAAGPKAQGNFSKLNFELARQQALSVPLTLFASASGQLASKNLDAYEQMVLGGAYGVRAYPQGEAPGDEGLIVNVELRWNTAPDTHVFGFFDQGAIRQHKHPWPGWQGGNPRVSNDYSIAGAGLGLNWARPKQYAVNLTLATPLGSNPGRDANGNDSDASRRQLRLWLQLAKYFSGPGS